MGTLYVDAWILRSSIAIRRDQIFARLCNEGWDVGTAMIEAREQARWEYRDWRSHEESACEAAEKDVAEYEEEMSIGGQPYKVPR